MKPYAFVLLPFGKTTDPDLVSIDFERVYHELIIPALKNTGLNIVRPESENLFNAYLQELLSADLILADLSLNNLDIGYLLGIRQALRATGVILINSNPLQPKLSSLSDHQFNYCLSNSTPNPTTLLSEIQKLSALVELAKTPNPNRPSSPVFQQIPQLTEPDWHIARVSNARSFWETHAVWERQRQAAGQGQNTDELLKLAHESPVAQFRAEALIEAGIILRGNNQVKLALAQFEQALDITPNHLKGLQEKGNCLLQLALQEKANQPLYAVRLHYISLLKEYPDNPETWMLLGNVDKEVWIKTWHKQALNTEQTRSIAAEGEARLRSAIESYRQAFRRNPGHYASGIQALTLMQVYQYLTGETRYFIEAKTMLGAVQYAAEYAPHPDYGSKATLGDLEILTGTPASVCNTYKIAIAQPATENDLNPTLSRLYLLQHLGFHLENVAAGIATLEKALANLP